MKLRIAMFFAVVCISLLLLFGCTDNALKEHKKIGCCDISETYVPGAPNKPTTCELKGELSEGIEKTATIVGDQCDWENLSVCTVEITKDGELLTNEIEDEDGHKVTTTEFVVSICSDKETTCLQSECSTMVCGPFVYDPTPIPAYGDMMSHTKSMESGDEDEAPPVKKKDSSINLFNSECMFLPMDETLKRVFENVKGTSVNIFRIGIGRTFEEYQRYRYLFPTSDYFCNVMPLNAIAKDRYMNYLLSPEEFAQKKAGTLQNLPTKKTLNPDFALKSEESPFMGKTYGNNAFFDALDENADGALYPNYKMINDSGFRYMVAGEGGDAVDGSPVGTMGIDKEFYANFLPFMYKEDMQKGLQYDPPAPAPFECDQPTDCYSGYCNYNDYQRAVCKKIDGTWAECGCNPYTKKCTGKKSQFNALWVDTTATGLLDRVEDFNSGTDKYIKDEILKIKIRRYGQNPDCDSDATGGCDDVDRNEECWFTPGDDVVHCDIEPTDTYIYSCTLSGSSAACTQNAQPTEPAITCSWDSGNKNISCNLVSGYPMSCIMSGSSARCGQSTGNADDDPAACILKEGYGGAQCNNPAVQQCTYNETSKKVNCGSEMQCVLAKPDEAEFNDVYHCGTPTQQSAEFTCAEPSGSEVECGSVGSELGEGGKAYCGLDDEMDPNTIFMSDTIFLGDPQAVPGEQDTSYVAYSMLSEDDFKDTDLYENCGLSSGSDYDILESINDGCCEGCNSIHVSNWGYDAYYRPDPVPNYVGACVEDDWGCHWDGDNWGHWLVVEKFVVIKMHAIPGNDTHGRIGDCYYDKGRSMIESRAFGWCEPCSYLTMAQEVMEPYGLEGVKPYEFHQQKQEEYLKNGVQPVIDVSKLILDTGVIKDHGPTMVVVGTVSLEDVKGKPVTVQNLRATLSHAKDGGCPRCLFAINIDNGERGSLGGEARMAKDKETLEAMFSAVQGSDNVGEKFKNELDIVGFKNYPSEYTLSDPALCSAEDRNEILFTKIENMSSYIHWTYGKSTLLTDLDVTYADTGCWGKVTDAEGITTDYTNSFFSYAYKKHSRLVRVGMLGMFYSNVGNFEYQLDAKDTYSTKFYPINKATRYYVSDKPLTMYSPIYEAEIVECEGCTTVDMSLGLCDRTCMDGVECTGPADANLKCPKKGLPEPCKPCSEMTGTAACTFEYADGTTRTIDYTLANLDALYPDIIAALPSPYKCCIIDEVGNSMSYYKESTSGKSTASIILPTTNNPLEDCGQPNLDQVTSGMCSATLPIKNYKITCVMK